MEVNKKAPWELMVRSSYLPTGVSYCFVRVPRSKANDNRLDRKTRGGTWVANGKPRDIPHQDRRAAIAGTRRSLAVIRERKQEGQQPRSEVDNARVPPPPQLVRGHPLLRDRGDNPVPNPGQGEGSRRQDRRRRPRQGPNCGRYPRNAGADGVTFHSEHGN
ncbi:unnamed protein product [Musa textilis]